MAGSLNQCQFIGNLGRDPEIRYMPNGEAVCNFSIACTETWKSDGETHESTEWVRLVAWRKLAEVCGEWLKQGSRVFVQGKMKTRKWQDKGGKDQYTTEVHIDKLVMLSSPKQDDDGERDGGRRSSGRETRRVPAPPPQKQQAQSKTGFDDSDGWPDQDIPF